MTTITKRKKSVSPYVEQRLTLEKSEKQAHQDQPDSYKDEATADKVVEIGPVLTDAPIKGIDPPSK